MCAVPMQLAEHDVKDADKRMSPSTHAALIDSLFQDPGPMFAGALCAAIAAVMTAIKAGDQYLWPCVSLLVITGAARALNMRGYKDRRSKSPLTAEEVARWENRYQVHAMLYTSSLGIWCLLSLLRSNDAVVHLISIAVTLCYMAAGSGRTYGRPWIFHVQMLLACGPVTVVLALYGSPYYFVMA